MGTATSSVVLFAPLFSTDISAGKLGRIGVFIISEKPGAPLCGRSGLISPARSRRIAPRCRKLHPQGLYR